MSSELVKDILQWDVDSWKVILNYWDKKVEWDKVKRALEIGSRKGGLSLWLALKSIHVICSDLINTQPFAQPLHNKYHVTNLITYQDINAFEIPFKNHFDLIVMKSVLGGIGRHDNFTNQKIALKAIYQALKPGGVFLFAENLKASSLHQFMRKKFVKWGSEWRYISLNEMKELLNAFSYFELKTNGVLATFGRTERQRNLLQIMDDFLLNSICSDNCKYIGYGIAIK